MIPSPIHFFPVSLLGDPGIPTEMPANYDVSFGALHVLLTEFQFLPVYSLTFSDVH